MLTSQVYQTDLLDQIFYTRLLLKLGKGGTYHLLLPTSVVNEKTKYKIIKDYKGVIQCRVDDNFECLFDILNAHFSF